MTKLDLSRTVKKTMKERLGRLVTTLFFVGILLTGTLSGGTQTLGQTKSLADKKEVISRSATGSEMRSMITTLEDDRERRKLVSQLKLLLATKNNTEKKKKEILSIRVFDGLSKRMDALGGEVISGVRAIIDLPNVYNWTLAQFSDQNARSIWFEIIWKLILALFGGLFFEWCLRKFLSKSRKLIEERNVSSYWVRVPVLLVRTFLDVLPILGFVGGSYALLMLIDPGPLAREVTLSFILANVAVRAVMAIGRMILTPVSGNLRLLPMRDVDANYLFIWVRRFADVSIYGYTIAHASVTLGLPQVGAEILVIITGSFLALMTIVFTLQNKIAVGNWLQKKGENQKSVVSLRTRISEIWHFPAILYILALYSVWVLSIEDGFHFLLKATIFTIVIFVAARLIVEGINRTARHLFFLNENVKNRYPSLEVRANRYLPVFERITAIVITLIASLIILQSWNVEILSWFTTPLGQQVLSSLFTVFLLLLITVALWEITSAIIERYLARNDERLSARTRTLLPLMRTTILVVLVVLVIMVTLSELGLNIAPLLAGAGVVGLAVGFGAQTLVKDIITGLFILVEDHISIGDFVKVGNHAGIIEKLTLRTIQLRDIGGTVHVIPFSEVTTLENLSKDFSRYVFDIGVAYREDIDYVVEVLQGLGDELMQDENFKDFILEPLEILGLDSFGDNAVIIKARITTKPVKQWIVGREFNRRIKNRFDELGIEIPFPHRTIYFGEDVSGNAPPARLLKVEAKQSTQSRAPIKKPVSKEPRKPFIPSSSGGGDGDGE